LHLAVGSPLLILRQSRRELLWLGVTAHPNAEWLARQLTEACGWDEPPRYLIRDRDGAYGAAFIRRIGPWAFATDWSRRGRLIGSIRQSRRRRWRAPSSPRSRIVPKYYNEVRTTYRCRRTRRFGVMCAEQGPCVRRRSWAGYTINTFEFEFPTGTSRVKPTTD
jgi:hypothetical protein